MYLCVVTEKYDKIKPSYFETINAHKIFYIKIVKISNNKIK